MALNYVGPTEAGIGLIGCEVLYFKKACWNQHKKYSTFCTLLLSIVGKIAAKRKNVIAHAITVHETNWR